MNIPTILQQFKPKQHNLLAILHALQNNNPQNYLTEDALAETAGYLKVTKSTVYGVAGYYTMFSLKPRGKYIIRICMSPVCQLLKSEEILTALHRKLGIKTGETTPCGLFTLEVSECLGQCQEAPSMMINQTVYNNLDQEKIAEILNTYRTKNKERL